MKSVLLVLVFLVGLVSMHESYGQQPTNSDSGTKISCQLILRDSEGHLIAFLDIKKVGYVDMKGLNSLLDYESTRRQDPIITIGETKFQLIQRTIIYNYDSQTVISDITLNDVQDGKITPLIRPTHDGIPGKAGDTLTNVWTFIRPV